MLGNLQVVVKGVDAAKVNVVSGADGKSILDESVAGNRTLSDLPAGTYGVGAARVAGYNAPELKLVSVDGGKTTQVELTFTKQDVPNNPNPTPTPSNPPARLSVESVVDTWGVDLPSINEGEFNRSKNVRIWASQTEEDVCVKVRVLDAQGNGVANAVIDVQNTRVGAVSVFSSCPGRVNPAPFTSDANGYVYIRFFAPIGFVPGALPLATISDLLGSDLLGPVKVTMTAAGTPVTEFKLFFINISHLYYQYRAQDGRTENLTERRTNGVVKDYVNLFKPRPGVNGSTSVDVSNNNPEDNAFEFRTWVNTKQPAGPLPTGNSGLLWLYTVTGPDANRVDLVCDRQTPAPASITTVTPSCLDRNGVISVLPKADVGLDELPLEVQVNATLWIVGEYGTAPMAFPLKTLSVTKTWIGTYLDINKDVLHHVLSWPGSDLTDANASPAYNAPRRVNTLASSDAPELTSAAVRNTFSDTFTIAVRNLGNAPAYNTNISDALPAELGVLTDTIQIATGALDANGDIPASPTFNALNPGGQTYDAINHVMTWNESTTGLTVFGATPARSYIIVRFNVYLRQKPGFCWDVPAFNATANYQVKPIGQAGVVGGAATICPSDPYRVVNGDKINDVTAFWYTGAPVTATPIGSPVLQDYNTVSNPRRTELWGVRPTFNLTKTLISPTQNVAQPQGTIFTYRINFNNAENRSPRYDAVRAAYPGQFNGAVRDNPYGRDVRLTDAFQTGIDFNDVTSPLNVSNNNPPDQAAGSVTYANPVAYQRVGTKGIRWNAIPIMGGGDTATTTVSLRGNLPNDRPGWYNCAFLDSKNLNQPDPASADRNTPFITPTNIAIGQPNLAPDWIIGNEPFWLYHGNNGANYKQWLFQTGDEANTDQLAFGIADCELVNVFVPGNPWIELTSLSERVGTALFTDVPGGFTIGGPATPATSFFYTFRVANSPVNSNAMATGVTTSVVLNNANVILRTADVSQITVYLCTDAVTYGGCAVFATGAGALSAAMTASSAAFAPIDLPLNHQLIYFIPARANDVGNTNATATSNYTNPLIQAPLLPLQVVEQTSVN